MRVLHLISASHARGAERVAASLIEALAADGVDGRLVALVVGAPDSGQLAVDSTLVTERRRRRVWLPKALRRLRREVRGYVPDVVLAHGALAALVAVLPLGIRRPPVIWHRILELPERPPHHPWTWLLRAVASRVHGVIAITPKTAEECRDLGFRGPIWLIGNHRPARPPAPPSSIAAFRQELDVGDAPLIATINHLVPQKNPIDAIRAFDVAAATHSSAHLVVVGGGPAADAVRRAAQQATASDRIHLLGHRDDVPVVLAAADIVLSTSAHDSMPGALIEAQLAGRAVVTYRVDGIEAVVADGVTGIVVPECEPAAAGRAIAKLLGDPDLVDSMGRAGSARTQASTTATMAPRYRGALSMIAPSPGDGLRVLHVLPDLGVGGAETALAVLARSALPHEVRQIVATIGGARRPLDETVHDQLQQSGVGYCDLGVAPLPTRSMGSLIRATARLNRLIRRLDVDVVDAALLDAALPLRLAPVRVNRVTHLVNTTYEPEVRDAVGIRRTRFHLLQVVDAFTARRDDAVVAITEAVRQSARRRLRVPATRLHVIPRGVETTATASSPERRAADDTIRAVTAGRLVPQKGHDTLIRATAAARRVGVDVTLAIAGEGPDHDDLSQLIHELGVSESVRLLGPVNAVGDLLSGADIFLLASRWEGQSNALLEAMAAGLPVIVGAVPALVEVVGDSGLCIDPLDEGAWVEAIAMLAQHPERRALLGAAARARVTERYDAREMSARLFALYRELAATAVPGSGSADRGQHLGPGINNDG